MPSDKKSARDIAVEALGDREGNVSAHLDRLLAEGELSPADKGLARELALGVVRRRGTLRAVLRAFLDQPNHKLPGAIENILHVALYQLLFLERVPDFAAVNEAVGQTARFRHPKQGGMVNGVLRTVARSLGPRQTGPIPVSRKDLPVSPKVYRTLDRPFLPDPQTDAAWYLSWAHSINEELAGRWIQRFGLAKAVDLAMQANVRAPVVLRVNRLRASVEDVLAALQEASVSAVRHSNGVSVVLDSQMNVADLEVFRKGIVQVQDPTATAVGLAASPRPGGTVLDFCAAPGTKTTHLAELMDNRGRIEAVDVSPAKLEMIESNCRRLGVTIVRTHLAAQAGALPPRGFDLVLADVPCSNTGVFSRRAEARWRFSGKMLSELAADQVTLAALAAEFVAPGGRLVYSTCSIEEEECSGAIRRVLSRNRRLELLREQMTLPGGAEDPAQWRDGGYYAILRAR